MNLNKKIQLILWLFVVPQCSVMAQQPRFYAAECESVERDGRITIIIWRTSRGALYAPHQAQRDAIHAILFAGISGETCLSQGPLLDGTEEMENFEEVQESFWGNDGVWSRYTASCTSVTHFDEQGDKSGKVYQVTVLKDELREYLEEQRIIKKLTDGF